MIQPLKLKRVEHQTEKQIMAAINQLGGYVIKNQASSTSGKGRSDLTACLNGRYYAIEVKRPQTQIKTTPYQLAVLIKVARAGGAAFYSKTAKMFDLTIYQRKIIKSKAMLTVKQVLFYLKQPQVMCLRIIDQNTMYLYVKGSETV